jgi:CRP-like cAMP-binding protein
MAETIKLMADEYLLHEGEESHQMYYLHSGTLAIFKRRGDAVQQIGTIYSGELVGEMSFLDQKPRSATVKALSECELIVIPIDKMDQLNRTLPSWYKALVSTLLDRLRRANARIRI